MTMMMIARLNNTGGFNGFSASICSYQLGYQSLPAYFGQAGKRQVPTTHAVPEHEWT